MSNQSLQLNPTVQQYLLDFGVREHPLLADLRAKTASSPASSDMKQMQIAPEQGAFLQMLVRMLDAQRIIEVGTFTGYSTLAMAFALADGAQAAQQILACDVSEEWTAIARDAWRSADVAGYIDLVIAPAADTLAARLPDAAGQYDLAFIDADKTGYDTYYELCLKLIRPGGVIAIDNVLWSGSVADPTKTSDDTEALRALNIKIHGDARVDISMLPLADGVTLVRKR